MLSRLVFAASFLALAGSVHAQSGPSFERYIVVLRDGAGPPAQVAENVARSFGGDVGHVYGTVLNGFSIALPAAAAARLANDPRVALIEEDLPMGIDAQLIPTGLDRSYASTNVDFVSGSPLIDGIDDMRVDADVAVLDTGIDRQHPDLNVVDGVNCLYSTGGPPWNRSYECVGAEQGEDGDDDHYHGTHVAGTIGAIDNGIGVVGVAPGVRLHAVKVLDQNGSGYTSGIIEGIDWAVAKGNIEVINMSLGGAGVSEAYKTAIDNAVAKGVVVVVAAGNSDADANNYSPAWVPSAVTVSALADFNGLPGGEAAPTCRTDIDDTLADFSNWGSAVDIAAPGVCILSTYPLEQGEYATISGTSMAAPHVAGAVALLASGYPTPLTDKDVLSIIDALTVAGNLDWTDDSGDGIQEPLLDVRSSIFEPVTVPGDEGEDLVAPIPVISSDAGSSTSVSPIPVTVDFGEPVSGFTPGDVTVLNGAVVVDSFPTTEGIASYTFNVTPSDDPVTVTIDVAAGVAVDGGNNANLAAAESLVITYDTSAAAPIVLSVSGYKLKGVQWADLTWSGTTGTNVDIYRDGSHITTTADDGFYSDNIGNKGGGSYTYQICEAGSTIACSDQMAVVF